MFLILIPAYLKGTILDFFVDKMAFAFYSNKTVNIKFLHVLYNNDAIRGHSITTYLDKKRYIEYSCLVMWTKGR